MRLLVIVLLVASLFGGYRWWQGRGDAADLEAAVAGGFVPVTMPDGAPANAVLVLAPPDCPSDEAQRAEALVAWLGAQAAAEFRRRR